VLDELHCQRAGLGQLGIGEREQGEMTGRQRPAAVVGDRGFVEPLISGNCQAKRHVALGVDLGDPTGALGVDERLGYQVVLRVTEYRRRLRS
jgi:hypothetical protein